MLKSKSKISTITDTDYETQILQVNRINAKVHDLNIESMREVDRLQSLIKEYQEITKMMYYFSEFGNRCYRSVYDAKRVTPDDNSHVIPINGLVKKSYCVMKEKVQTFCSAMERGEKE